MRKLKSFSMAFAFVALFATSLTGCDVSGLVSGILTDILQGGSGCGGACGDCGSCAGCGDCGCGCDCGGCTDCGGCACNVGCDPTLRDLQGRAQGFHGPGVHPGRRMANAVQLRLTASGYDFLEAQVPSLISGFLGAGGFPLPGSLSANGQSPGKIYIELRQFALNPAINCTGNANNGWGGGHDCIRATMYAYFRTCDNNGGCTQGENVPISINDIPIIGSLTCQLNLDAARRPAGGSDNGLRITAADVTTVPETTPAARANYSRLAILDAQVDPNTLEREDVAVSCPSISVNCTVSLGLLLAGAVADGVSVSCSTGFPWDNCNCNLNPNGLIGNVITDLRGDLNGIIDYQLAQNTPTLCQAAYQNLDCPTGTTYVAGTNGMPGSCTINGTTRCMELLLGAEARVDVGPALAAVSPGIEAVVDFLGAMGGHGQTRGQGSNAMLYMGLEGWYAGIRAFPHNPCVPIEHPANSIADCPNNGNGWEYEAIPNGTFAGRCVPAIPLIPELGQLRGDTPDEIGLPSTGTADGDYEMGAAISEDFAKYAMWKVWDSGLLCLSVGSWLDPTLSPSLIGLALLTGESKQRLFFPMSVDPNIDPAANASLSNTTSVALTLRPQAAPQIMIEEVDDPCQPGEDKVMDIDVTLPTTHLDLSIWGQDRWALGGTVETDVHVVVRLDLGSQPASQGCKALAAGEIGIGLPTLEFIGSNGNAQPRYLPDSPNLSPLEFRPNDGGQIPVALGFRTISGIAGGVAGGLLPSLNAQEIANGLLAGDTLPIAIPFRLRLDSDALQYVQEPNAPCSGGIIDSGTRSDPTCAPGFIAFYADLEPAPAMPLRSEIETSVQITHLDVPANAGQYDMQSEGFGQGALPSVEFRMGASGPANAEYEYRYRTTFTAWSEWQTSNYGRVQDKGMLVQGRQQVFAQARLKGDSQSMDMQSARANFVVDVTAPMMEVYARPNGGAQLQALDLVAARLEYRTQEPGDDFSDWTALPANGIQNLDVEDGSVIEVRDEEGNVASNAAALSGRPNAATAGACGACATVGAPTTKDSRLAYLAIAGLGLTLASRRRRRAA